MGKAKEILINDMIRHPELYNTHTEEEFWTQCRKEELLEREYKPTKRRVNDKYKSSKK